MAGCGSLKEILPCEVAYCMEGNVRHKDSILKKFYSFMIFKHQRHLEMVGVHHSLLVRSLSLNNLEKRATFPCFKVFPCIILLEFFIAIEAQQDKRKLNMLLY